MLLINVGRIWLIKVVKDYDWQLSHAVLDDSDSGSKWGHQNKMAALVRRIFWPNFRTGGGSWDVGAIFIYDTGFNWKQVEYCMKLLNVSDRSRNDFIFQD